jgi:hypothetical protein
MMHQNAITAILAILSIAALAGVFTVQVADAQLPRLDVSGQGVGVQTEEFGLIADTRGVDVESEEFILSAEPLGDVDVGTEEFLLTAGPRAENGVLFDTREFGISATPEVS